MHGLNSLTEQIWLDAFAEDQIDTDFYTHREVRSEDELFPWDFIDAGVTKNFLLREWHAGKCRDRYSELPSEMFRLWCYEIQRRCML